MSPQNKGVIIIGVLGLLLLAGGAYCYLSDAHFLKTSLQAQGVIENSHNETIRVSKAGWFTTGLRSAHECSYTIKYRPELAGIDIVAQLKVIKQFSCLSSGMPVRILYDPKDLQNISFFVSSDQVTSVGKPLIAFGVFILGLAYFASVIPKR